MNKLRSPSHLSSASIPLLWSLAFVWIVSGIVSLYGINGASLVLLNQVHLFKWSISVWPLHVKYAIIFSLALADIILGLLLLFRWQLKFVLCLQCMMMLIYTVLISIGAPHLWLDPFGSVAKNIPMIVLTYSLLRVRNLA